MGWMDSDNPDGIGLGNMGLMDLVGLGLGGGSYLAQAIQLNKQQKGMSALAQAINGQLPATTAVDVLGNAGPRQTDDGLTLAALPSPQAAAQIGQPNQNAPGAIYSQAPSWAKQAAMAHLRVFDPSGALKVLDDTMAPTNEQKNAGAAFGYGTPEAQAALRGIVNKAAANIQDVRPGGTLYDVNADHPLFSAPNADGAQIGWGPNGPVMAMVPGAAQAKQAAAYATESGQGLAVPQPGYQNGQPVFTNRTAAAGGNMLANPYLSPSGVPGAPQAGQGAPSVQPGRFGGYSASGSAPVTPAPAPGYVTGQEGLAKANTDRYSALTTAAADSPMRVNVLDNVISLASSAGPGSDVRNKILGYAASTPLLGNLLAGAKDDVSKFQELQKFMSQNALRNWQAAGGTGTDSQMEAFMHANPNSEQFPQAVTAVAQWNKASELAVQAKANAADQFLSQNGSDTSKLNQFESTWRKNFDPRVYQMTLMNPQQLQGFAGNLSGNDRAALLQKYRTAKLNGWLQ